MVLFKINGERNSGTNFLKIALVNNAFPVYEQTVKNRTMYHWKHGIPSADYKTLDDRVIDIFIFRELNGWLNSMYNNNYHLVNMGTFKDFLTLPQISCENSIVDYRTGDIFNADDNGRTIFEIREWKFRKICEYRDANKDVILVNLSYLQDENNLNDFLCMLETNFMSGVRTPPSSYSLKIPHTKNALSYEKNRSYGVDDYDCSAIIEASQNREMETFINNLTYKLYTDVSKTIPSGSECRTFVNTD